MSVDNAIESAADRLDELAVTAARRGKPVEKAAPLLEEDADFLRKMTPSKVGERLRAGSPPKQPRQNGPTRSGGRNGVVTIAAAFALGVVIAKIVDWRSFAE